VGYSTPPEFGDLIRGIRENTPGIEKAIISVHCHNDLGLAVANSLAALQAGARQVECTINGLGERAGNAALEEIVMALYTRQQFYYGLSTGINTTELYPTQPHGVELYRARGAGQQGHRGRQRLCPRGGHPPGRHPQEPPDV
jgi:2-isopropylmalate synthase